MSSAYGPPVAALVTSVSVIVTESPGLMWFVGDTVSVALAFESVPPTFEVVKNAGSPA